MCIQGMVLLVTINDINDIINNIYIMMSPISFPSI